jgi:hypothetical protein
MDEKVDLVEVLTRQVENLQRGKTRITSVYCATQHKIVIYTYFTNQRYHIWYCFFAMFINAVLLDQIQKKF